METVKREVWWLAGLEATLFLSLPFWEFTAPYAEPFLHPARFVGCILAAATASTLSCHIGPAFFASRLDGEGKPWLQVLMLWLAFGYLEWLLAISVGLPSVRSAASSSDWPWLGMAVPFWAAVALLGFLKSWWKSAAIIGLVLGIGILIGSLATSWPGLWTQNPSLASEPLQLDWPLVKGMLLSAAPAVAIGWRIGRIESNPRRLFLTGFAGVWLPLILSVTAASLATEAGVNLHWRPSLFRDFWWALISLRQRLGSLVESSLIWTLLFPAVVSAVALKDLASRQLHQRPLLRLVMALCLLIMAVVSVVWRYDGLFSLIATPTHNFWASSVWILGSFAGLACVVSRPTR